MYNVETMDDHKDDNVATMHAILCVTWLGLGINVLLTILKFFAGIVGHSSVLVADAVHSLSDLVTDFAILLGMRFWNRPADTEHPYGHAKIETLVTLFIGFILALVGIGLLYDAVRSLFDILDGAERPAPTWLPLIAALVCIALKEWLYRVTVNVGMTTKSSATIANAWHHRSDAISSIPAVVAVGACLSLGEKYVFLDPVGTVVVSFMIIHVAWEIIRPTFAVLLDSGASELQRQAIAEEIRSFAEVKDLHKLRSRYIGPTGLVVDVHIQVDSSMSITEAHSLSHRIKHQLLQSGKNILDVFVHVEPCSHDLDTEAITIT